MKQLKCLIGCILVLLLAKSTTAFIESKAKDLLSFCQNLEFRASQEIHSEDGLIVCHLPGFWIEEPFPYNWKSIKARIEEKDSVNKHEIIFNAKDLTLLECPVCVQFDSEDVERALLAFGKIMNNSHFIYLLRDDFFDHLALLFVSKHTQELEFVSIGLSKIPIYLPLMTVNQANQAFDSRTIGQFLLTHKQGAPCLEEFGWQNRSSLFEEIENGEFMRKYLQDD